MNNSFFLYTSTTPDIKNSPWSRANHLRTNHSLLIPITPTGATLNSITKQANAEQGQGSPLQPPSVSRELRGLMEGNSLVLMSPAHSKSSVKSIHLLTSPSCYREDPHPHPSSSCWVHITPVGMTGSRAMPHQAESPRGKPEPPAVHPGKWEQACKLLLGDLEGPVIWGTQRAGSERRCGLERTLIPPR